MPVFLLPDGNFHLIDEPELLAQWEAEPPVDYIPRRVGTYRDFYVRKPDIAVSILWFEQRGFFIEKRRHGPVDVEMPKRGEHILFRDYEGNEYDAQVTSLGTRPGWPPNWERHDPGFPPLLTVNLKFTDDDGNTHNMKDVSHSGVNEIPRTWKFPPGGSE